MTTEEAEAQEAVFEAVIRTETKVFGLTVLRVGQISGSPLPVPDSTREFMEQSARKEFAKRCGSIVWPTVKVRHSPLSVWVTAETA